MDPTTWTYQLIWGIWLLLSEHPGFVIGYIVAAIAVATYMYRKN